MFPYLDPLNAHIAAVNTVAADGNEPPREWTNLHARYQKFTQLDHPNLTRLVAALLDDSGADVDALRALALAEAAEIPRAIGVVGEEVRARVHERLRAIHDPVAPRVYGQVAKKFNDAAKIFTSAANVIDPDTDADGILRSNAKARQAWLTASTAAHALDELAPVLAAAAELAGAPAGIAARRPEAEVLRLPLVCDPSKAHRRRVWEAWEATGTCGRWSALHRTGVPIHAHRDPQALTDYRTPLPMQLVLAPGGRRETVDPEDHPNATAAQDNSDWSVIA